jgi:flagellar hook assembly protein FlgD
MQEQRQRTNLNTARRRTISREERSPNALYTALTIGVVALLLAVTFAADWLRTPEVKITNAPQFLSPNHDNSFDTATINYQVSEEAEVSARVLNESSGIVRSLLDGQKETAGQHFLVWNGLNDLGQQATDGNYRLEVSVRGSMRSSSTSVVLIVDSTPPNLELLNLQDGARVRTNLLTVEGVTEPGSTVWLNQGALPIPVDGQGRFHTQSKLAEGVNKIDVRAVDEAGNTTTLSRAIDLVTALPQVVISSPVEGAWINTLKVTVEGQAPAGVTLKINNQPVTIATDGQFRYDMLLDEGDQQIQVMAIDDVGNETSVERTIHVKTRGPRLEVNIADGQTFSDTQLQLSGTTSPGATLTINRAAVSVGSLGDFQTAIQLVDGDNNINIEARDQAGNTTSITRRVRYAIPNEPTGLQRLWNNLGVLPAVTIPAVLLLSLLVGFFLYRQNQLSIQLSVDAQDFVPGLPQEGKNLTLRLELNQQARVTLEVLDQSGQAQAVLLDNRRRTARQHIFLWDGYDDYGRPVPSGVYTVRATAGAPPIKVSSAVQVQIEEDAYVYRKAGQFEPIQSEPQIQPRRRIRQNRKRI